MDETATILAANQAFYDAHEQRDITAMDKLWQHSDDIVCTHPGWPTLRGRATVMESWARIFSGPGRTQFILTDIHVVVRAETAWVTLSENIVDRAATGSVAATNVFVRTDDGWSISLHHGSPVMGP